MAMATTLSRDRVETVIVPEKAPLSVSAPWWGHLLWIIAAAVFGFAVTAIFATLLHLPRALFVAPYVVLGTAFLYGYVRWSGVDIARGLRRHWAWGVTGAAVAGAFVVNNVLRQPASPAPTGLELFGAIIWLGVIYGTIDALLLSVLPMLATWQALSALGWTANWPGRVGSGALALVASLAVAAAYHLGYAEFRNPSVAGPLIGNGVLSLATLLTMNPIAAVGAHIAMHIAAVLHGIDTAIQLPPHYGF
jgi:hypothetical protein